MSGQIWVQTVRHSQTEGILKNVSEKVNFEKKKSAESNDKKGWKLHSMQSVDDNLADFSAEYNL